MGVCQSGEDVEAQGATMQPMGSEQDGAWDDPDAMEIAGECNRQRAYNNGDEYEAGENDLPEDDFFAFEEEEVAVQGD